MSGIPDALAAAVPPEHDVVDTYDPSSLEYDAAMRERSKEVGVARMVLEDEQRRQAARHIQSLFDPGAVPDIALDLLLEFCFRTPASIARLVLAMALYAVYRVPFPPLLRPGTGWRLVASDVFSDPRITTNLDWYIMLRQVAWESTRRVLSLVPPAGLLYMCCYRIPRFIYDKEVQRGGGKARMFRKDGENAMFGINRGPEPKAYLAMVEERKRSRRRLRCRVTGELWCDEDSVRPELVAWSSQVRRSGWTGVGVLGKTQRETLMWLARLDRDGLSPAMKCACAQFILAYYSVIAKLDNYGDREKLREEMAMMDVAWYLLDLPQSERAHLSTKDLRSIDAQALAVAVRHEKFDRMNAKVNALLRHKWWSSDEVLSLMDATARLGRWADFAKVYKIYYLRDRDQSTLEQREHRASVMCPLNLLWTVFHRRFAQPLASQGIVVDPSDFRFASLRVHSLRLKFRGASSSNASEVSDLRQRFGTGGHWKGLPTRPNNVMVLSGCLVRMQSLSATPAPLVGVAYGKRIRLHGYIVTTDAAGNRVRQTEIYNLQADPGHANHWTGSYTLKQKTWHKPRTEHRRKVRSAIDSTALTRGWRTSQFTVEYHVSLALAYLFDPYIVNEANTTLPPSAAEQSCTERLVEEQLDAPGASTEHRKLAQDLSDDVLGEILRAKIVQTTWEVSKAPGGHVQTEQEARQQVAFEQALQAYGHVKPSPEVLERMGVIVDRMVEDAHGTWERFIQSAPMWGEYQNTIRHLKRKWRLLQRVTEAKRPHAADEEEQKGAGGPRRALGLSVEAEQVILEVQAATEFIARWMTQSVRKRLTPQARTRREVQVASTLAVDTTAVDALRLANRSLVDSPSEYPGAKALLGKLRKRITAALNRCRRLQRDYDVYNANHTTSAEPNRQAMFLIAEQLALSKQQLEALQAGYVEAQRLAPDEVQHVVPDLDFAHVWRARERIRNDREQDHGAIPEFGMGRWPQPTGGHLTNGARVPPGVFTSVVPLTKPLWSYGAFDPRNEKPVLSTPRVGPLIPTLLALRLAPPPPPPPSPPPTPAPASPRNNDDNNNNDDAAAATEEPETPSPWVRL